MNKTKRNITVLSIAITLILAGTIAYASDSKKPKNNIDIDITNKNYIKTSSDADAYSKSNANSKSNSESTSEATGGSATGGSATNEGIDIDASDNSRVENNNTSIVLVPNNNTESCIRVWGIAFGRDGAAGSIGIPWRSAACDFEQAADDAFAAGERDLGWFWKCKNKNLYKGFKLDGMSKDEAMHNCHLRAVGYVDAYSTIDNLREQIEFLNNERSIERQKCKEASNRLSKAWQESCGAK